MRRKLTSLLLTLAVIITLALPYNVSAVELNEVPLTTESEQINNEGITNPTLENTIEDTAFPKQESSSNPEDVTAEDSNISEMPGDEDSDVPETPGTEDSNASDTPELSEDGSVPETPSEDETGSGVSDHNPGEETTGTGSSDADIPGNAELPAINETLENGEGDMEDLSSVNSASASVAYPQMTGYYLVSISGLVVTSDGKTARLTEPCDVAFQKTNSTTTYVTKNRFLPRDEIVLTFFYEGIGKSGKYMQTTGGYNVVNGPGYGSKTDANRNVLSYYTDTTISHMDEDLTEIFATTSMLEQRESAFKEPKEWTRSIQILFYNDRSEAPENVHFTLDPNNPEQYQLCNVDSTMEYRVPYIVPWTSCTDEPMFFPVPESFDMPYNIRYKGTETSGPSNFVELWLPVRRAAPAVSINWVDETLNKPDVTTGLEYSFADSEYAPADTLLENGVTELLNQIPTPGPVYLRFRYAADAEQAVSLVTSIRLYPRGPVPEGISINPNTYIATGVSSSLQYFVEGDTNWRSISGTTLALRDYASRDKEVTVKFRTKATSSTCLSNPLVLKLPMLAAAPSTLALNFADETITGFQPGQSYQYRIGTGKWGDVTLSNQAFSIKNLIVTSGDRLLSIRTVGSESTQATDAWQVTLPKREAAPTTCVFVYNDESYPGKAVLSGVSSDMEYQVKGATTWTALTGPQKVFDLPKSATTYYFRLKSTASSFASLNKTVTLYAPATAPTNALNMTTEKLTVSSTMEYRIDNGAYMKMPSGETALLVTDYINALSGSATKTITIRYSATATKPASLEKTIKLVARRAAPTKVTYTANDQYIRGATTSMQYREVGTTSWKNITKTSFSIASILNGRTDVVMEFRYKPTTSAVGSYTQLVNCF